MKKLRGFTVTEILVGLTIFILLSSASSLVFTRLIKSHRATTLMQKNVQDAQFAINIVAKTLRTSTILSSSPGDEVDLIRLFDNSQARCVEYRFNSVLKTLETRLASGVGTREDCEAPNPFEAGDVFQPLFSSEVVGSFTYTSSNGNPADPISAWRVGRATISLELISPGGILSGDVVRIQTTVSLRDYMEFQFNALDV